MVRVSRRHPSRTHPPPRGLNERERLRVAARPVRGRCTRAPSTGTLVTMRHAVLDARSGTVNGPHDATRAIVPSHPLVPSSGYERAKTASSCPQPRLRQVRGMSEPARHADALYVGRTRDPTIACQAPPRLEPPQLGVKRQEAGKAAMRASRTFEVACRPPTGGRLWSAQTHTDGGPASTSRLLP